MDETDPAQLERVHSYFDNANGMPALGSAGDYSSAFELCLPDPSARKALLQELVEGKSPGFAQRVFGGLLVAAACDLVVTTNFDRLIDRGFAEAQRAGTDLSADLNRELNVAGLDSTARATTALQNRQWPLVLNLHGDFREKALKNTDLELQTQDAALRQFVVDASRQFGLVVSGYSGRDDSVMEMLSEATKVPDGWPFGIWWLTRSSEDVAPQVRALLRDAAANNTSANLVVAPSFDETMTAIAKQVTVDDDMREYFNRLHPKPRSVPAAVATSRRQWPVLRFNALPIFHASVTATRVSVPSAWTRRDVRDALPRGEQWPVVVSGPGEVLFLGELDAALEAVRTAATNKSHGEPGHSEVVNLDLLADDAPFHHRTFLLQLIARAVAEVSPVWTRTSGRGDPDLLIDTPREGEPAQFQAVRSGLNKAYSGSLFGYLDSRFGQTDQGRGRRWVEKIELSFDRQAGQAWLLFRPWTWVSPLARPEERAETNRVEFDPASPWRAEHWAKRKRNEDWAAIIAAWSALLAPQERTTLSIHGVGGASSVGSIVLGRTNAYSRPA